jgi:hypothetical protein
MYVYNEGQEMGAIAPVPKNACKKKLRGVVDRAHKKIILFT